MVRSKLKTSGSVIDMMVEMSEGNPGAASVCGQIMQADPVAGFMVILSMDDMNMRGPMIWIGYKDHCKEDIGAFIKCVEDRDQAMVDTINAEPCEATGTHERAVTSGASYAHAGR